MRDILCSDNQVKILVIEDSPTQAEQLRYILEKHHFNVLTASGGPEALAMLDRDKPSLVISDIVMPEMDGYHLCKEIKSNQRFGDVPVILLTSLSEPKDVLKGLECGADNFIIKPFDEYGLVNRVRHILMNEEVRRENRVQMGVEISFHGRRYHINSERKQILDLLISTYEAAVRQNSDLIRAQRGMKLLNEQLEQKVEERTASLSAEISERRRAEEALRESEKRYRLLLESVTDYIYTVNMENGRPVSSSHGPGCMAVTGFTPEEFAADPQLWYRMVHDGDRLTVLAQIDKVLAGNADPLEHRILHKNGEIRWVRNTPVLRSSPGGRVVAYDGLVSDITERRKLESQLQHAQKMEALGTLVGGIAHDFNNILQVITNYMSMLQMEMDKDNPRYRYVEETLIAADRAVSLTRSLLTFGRKQEIAARAVNLNEIIPGVEKMLRRILREDIELRISLAETDLVVMGDQPQIEQVLMNLAINARDAMPAGGTISVGTSLIEMDGNFREANGFGEPGPYALLTFSDNGEGMDDKVKQRIFEPFFTTKGAGQGTGLGLSVCHGIIRQHNGYINCYSERGQGTIFKIYLPLISAVAEKRELPVPGFLPAGTEMILLAEDDEQLRTLGRELLEKFGYMVVTAHDGEDALAKFNENRDKIELVMLDIVMPKLNGREVYAEIASINPKIKVIFTSGYSPDVFRMDSLDECDIPFLSKPLMPGELIECLRKVLDKDSRQ